MKVMLFIVLCLFKQIHAQSSNDIINFKRTFDMQPADVPKFKDQFLFETNWSKIFVYDFSDAKNPKLITTIDSLKSNDFQISNNLLICPSDEGSLRVFDISNCYNIKMIYKIDSVFIYRPIKIEIIKNNIFVLEQLNNSSVPSPYGYSLSILKLNDQGEPIFVERTPISYETTSDYNPVFLSISNYLYFSDTNLGTFVYQIIDSSITKINNPFPSFYKAKFSNGNFYFTNNDQINIYNLDNNGNMFLIDSLNNIDQYSHLSYFDIVGDIIIQAFGWPSNFTLRLSMYNSISKSIENKGEFIDTLLQPSISNIVCNEKIIIVKEVSENKAFIFSYNYEDITNISFQKEEIQLGFKLYQNYPNPFNPTTNIGYAIPKTDFVALKVYDLLGREISNLVCEKQSAGNHQIRFDASNLSSGIYFYSLISDKNVITKKFILLK